MKFFFDLLPVFLFFVAFKVGGSISLGSKLGLPQLDNPVYLATAVAIAASVAQIAWSAFRRRRVETMAWISLGIIVVFGGATLILRDETFIKWKPTVLYWFFATALFVRAAFFKKNLIEVMLQEQLSLPAQVWRALNAGWCLFFLVLGAVNLYVAFHFSTNTWVNFKVFGTTGLLFAFALIQGLVLSRYLPEEEKGSASK